jgi:hypothetical protein
VRVSAAHVTPVVSPPIPPFGLTALSAMRRAARWLPWVAGLLALLATMLAIEPLPIGVFYDDAEYVILAKSLATGNGYRFRNLPGAPSASCWTGSSRSM